MNRYDRKELQAGEKYPCLECEKQYEAIRTWHYFCSSKCRVKYWLKEKYDSKRIKELEDRIKALEGRG